MTGHHLYRSPDDPVFTVMARGQVRQVVEAYSTQYGLLLPQRAKDLICAMLHADPHRRPTLEMILNCPYLSLATTTTTTTKEQITASATSTISSAATSIVGPVRAMAPHHPFSPCFSSSPSYPPLTPSPRTVITPISHYHHHHHHHYLPPSCPPAHYTPPPLSSSSSPFRRRNVINHRLPRVKSCLVPQ